MSGLIPQSEVDRANEDIVGVIRGYLPELKKTGKNWSARCPFHSEKSASFTVNAEKEMFYCFGCSAHGNAVGFVMDHQGLSFPDAVAAIIGEVARDGKPVQRKQTIRAIRCELPGHAEDREKTERAINNCYAAQQHPYFARNNTAPQHGCYTLKGFLMVQMTNNIGENVNMAAINADGDITYAAGSPSFGSTAILEPADSSDHDGKTILCVDYAHAWRIWWAQCGKSRVLAALDHNNFLWMLGACKDRFTHIGCDPADADEYVEAGRQVVAVPLDPYTRQVRRATAQLDTEAAHA